MESTVKNKFHLVLYLLGLIGLAALFCYFLGQIHMIANTLIVSILITYLIAPGVHYLTDKWKFPKPLSIIVVYIAFLGAIAFFIAYLWPIAEFEFQRLTGNLGNMGDSLSGILAKWATTVQGVLPTSLQGYIDPQKFNSHELIKYLQAKSPAFMRSTAPGLLSGVRSAATILTGAILVPLLVFYILMDARIYKESFIGCLPKAWRANGVDLLRRVDYVLGKFIRGQLIVCVTIGFFVAVALWLLVIDYAILIVIFSGAIDIIPYVGVALSYIPAFIVALINKGPLFAIGAVVVLQVVHWLEGHIIVPAVVGHSVKLPPLTVMVALIAGAELGGIMGMLVAVPVTAIGRVIIEFYIEKNPAFGPLTEEDMREPSTPYPADPNNIVPPSESVKQIMGEVRGRVRSNKFVRNLNEMRKKTGQLKQETSSAVQEDAQATSEPAAQEGAACVAPTHTDGPEQDGNSEGNKPEPKA